MSFLLSHPLAQISCYDFQISIIVILHKIPPHFVVLLPFKREALFYRSINIILNIHSSRKGRTAGSIIAAKAPFGHPQSHGIAQLR